uniref:Uncharacterized protein n=1 Tax=Octopus bimaculoides TaxID=37653 RepID=A0A0L8G2C6_OCTBM
MQPARHNHVQPGVRLCIFLEILPPLFPSFSHMCVFIHIDVHNSTASQILWKAIIVYSLMAKQQLIQNHILLIYFL